MRALPLAAIAVLTVVSAAPPTYAAAGAPASVGQMSGHRHHHGRGHGGPRVYGYYAPNYGYGYYTPYNYAPVPYDWTRAYGVTPSYAPAWSSGYVSPSYAPRDWTRGFVSQSVPLGVVPLADPPRPRPRQRPAEVAPAPVCTPRLDVPTGIYIDCP